MLDARCIVSHMIVCGFQDSSVVVVKHRADARGVLRSVFAVCDGHGMLGEQAAEIAVT